MHSRRKAYLSEISTNLEVSYIVFNMRDPILGQNKYLRQALSLAYDSDLFNQIYLNGRAIRRPGAFAARHLRLRPSTLRTLTRRTTSPKPGNSSRRRDTPAGSMRETGRQLELTYDIGSDSTMAREYAAFDIRCFEQLGIRMKLQVNTFSQYLERSIKGTFQMSSGAWIADYPDPEDFLMLLYGPNAPPGPNAVGIFEPRVRQALRADEGHGGYAGTGGR